MPGGTAPDVLLRRVWPLWLGLAVSVAGLSRPAVQGFAPGGRFPVLPALGIALGIALVLVTPPRGTAADRLERPGATRAAGRA